MSAKQHRTPLLIVPRGDWSGSANVSLGLDDAFGQDGGRDYHLATVVHGDPDELQANARVFAAAFVMRQALIELKEAVEYTPLGVRGIKAVQKAQEALNYAESAPCPAV